MGKGLRSDNRVACEVGKVLTDEQLSKVVGGFYMCSMSNPITGKQCTENVYEILGALLGGGTTGVFLAY